MEIKPIKNNHTIATLTNLAYGYAGWALLNVNLPVAIACFLLMLGSGVHHHYLKRSTRKYDFIAMYIVLLALVGQYFHVEALYGIMGMVGLSVVLWLIWGSSQAVIGVGVAAVLVLLHLSAGFASFKVFFVFAVAFVFNYIGDEIAPGHHDVIHGISWHIPSAYGIYLTSMLL